MVNRQAWRARAKAAEDEVARWRAEAEERGEKLANCVTSLLATRQELSEALTREDAHSCDPFGVREAAVAGQVPLRQEAADWRHVAMGLAAAMVALHGQESELDHG